MPETQRDSSKSHLLVIIGILVIIILLLLGWRITKFVLFGIELAPPVNSTIESILSPIFSPTQPLLQPTSHPVAPAATEPFVTKQSSPESFADMTVSANASNGVQFIAPSSGNYTFTIKDGIYCTPSICRSIIHGYLGRDIVWKDFSGLPHPMDQDYELGCWENLTASNTKCAEGMSATIYMNAQQGIRWIIMEDKDAFADNKGSVILSVTLNP